MFYSFICPIAIIAFISKTLADILDDEIAGIAWERAKGIMDLHCSMSEARREKLEEKNRLT